MCPPKQPPWPGTLALGKLIYLYDDNGISIEGSTDLSFTEDVSRRFQAYGWQVIRVADGNDLESIAKAITNARAKVDQPSLIMVKTQIGFWQPQTRQFPPPMVNLWVRTMQRPLKNFSVGPWTSLSMFPRKSMPILRPSRMKAKATKINGTACFDSYRKDFPDEATAFDGQMRGELPLNWQDNLPVFFGRGQTCSHQGGFRKGP